MVGNNDDGQDLTSEECVRAGMYWFGRSDFAAADAWWKRALEIDPANTRAQECLRLLSRSSSTGLGTFENGVLGNDFFIVPVGLLTDDLDFASEPSSENVAILTPGDDDEPSIPMKAIDDDFPAMVLDPSGDLRDESSPPGGFNGSRDLPMGEGPHGAKFPYYDDPDPTPPTPTDAFDFAATGQHGWSSGTPTPSRNVPTSYVSPWDDGPSRTSVLTIDADDNGYDAVPDPTPLPAIERERFFSRSEPETPIEIIDYLRETGDLPDPDPDPDPDLDPSPPPAPTASAPSAPRAPSGARGEPSAGGIRFDEPVEFERASPTPARTSAPPHPETAAALLQEGRQRFQLHDFAGALEVLESVPPESAEQGEARNLIASSRRQMLKMYESKIGDFDQVPKVLISNEQIIWLNLNHRAGFILSQIDGSVTYEDIISLSGMPRLDTVRILSQLLQDRVIGVD